MITHNPDTLLQRPWRGPIEIPEALREYYEGKTVVEIGCAAGDYIPGWLKYAKHYTGYEKRRDWYSLAAGRADIGDNVTLLNEFVTPESIPEAALYYSWTPVPPYQLFVDRMRAAGKTGIFAFYGGVSIEDCRELKDPNGDRMGHPLAWTDWPTKVVSFETSESDNREFFDSYAEGRRMMVILKVL